ncbi:MAG: hypothetical protein KY468_09040 [Armatimonadetes bacterium]|nr:hypothetical protein [Armatimonadota bacterium]
MADFDFPVEDNQENPAAPLLWVSYQGFQRATGEELRTPVRDELKERLNKGLASLDGDFPNWLEEVSDAGDGVTLRFRDLEAVRNVASKLRDRGLLPKEDRELATSGSFQRGDESHTQPASNNPA